MPFLGPLPRLIRATYLTAANRRATLGPGTERVPGNGYTVAGHVPVVESGVDDHQRSARFHLSAGLWLTCRAARVGPDTAVTSEESTPAERLGLFTRASALSTRESELL